MELTFEVEQAGCASCAARVREALAPVARVDAVDVDEGRDAATVRVRAEALSEDEVNRLLHEASGAGHEYRVAPGSWRAVS